MVKTRNIKVWVCLVFMATSMAAPAYGPGQLQLDIIDMAAISRMTPQQLEALAEGLAAEEIMRTKRSSVQDLATSVVSKASSGLQSKVGLLGQASAGITSFIASASSKNGHAEQGYSYEPVLTHELETSRANSDKIQREDSRHNEDVNFWGLKKSILYTLFQAVKAITGGVTILKGQLIKGGGALAATLGKVISSKGDAVSNVGKKIVSSAALSPKKPVSHSVYGPPQEYIPSGYGVPPPAHYAHSAPAHTAPTGFAAHKYPSHLDGRGKLSGVHAGVLVLAPLEDAGVSHHYESTGHTALEPPPSLLHTVYSAFKDVFSSAASHTEETVITDEVPPPPQPMPPFKPMTWGAVNSYGEPAISDSYTDYSPRNPYPPYNIASSKHSATLSHHKQEGLTKAKIQKINANLDKLNAYINENHRSSEEQPSLNKQYADMLRKGLIPLLPTPVVKDNEIGVLPGEYLPEPRNVITTTSPTTTTVTAPKNSTEKENTRRKKDTKYILRGNRIVEV